MEFGSRLYKLRKEKGLSQEELANHLEVTRQTVSKWELGDSTPDMDKLVLLGELFDISLDELGAKMMTEENKRKVRKGLKVFGIFAAVVLAIDVISMIVYFLRWGIPQ